MTRVAIVLCGAATLLSQPSRVASPQQPATGTIRGRIVAAASGDPIRNARVSVTDDYERPPVLSDADGRFTFPALPAGSFTLVASKAGFAKTTFGARSPAEAGRVIRVAGGAAVDDVVVALPRGAAIAGRVVDDTGEPVPGASVMIERVVGRTRATPAPIVELTDEAGHYRIGGLSAGPVLVSVFAAARSLVMLPGGGVMSGGNDVGQRIYYPGGVHAERGEPLLLQAGDEKLGVDLVTPANVPVGRSVAPAPREATVVSGRIVSVQGRPLSGAQVVLKPGGATEASQRATVSDADGAYQFVLPHGASGTFRVGATRVGYLPAWYGQRDQSDVPEEITVRAGEVKANLTVALALTAVIAGRIFDENGEPVEGAWVRTSIIRFVDGQRRLVAVPSATRPTDDLGRFRLSRLPVGEYIVSAVVGQIVGTDVAIDLPGYAVTYFPGTPNPAEAQLVSIGRSQELTGVDFSLVRTPTARIAGRAFDAAGEPVGGGIMLTPSRRSGVVAPVALGARIERDGRFEFRNVPPGDYVLQVSRHRRGSWSEGDTASQFVMVTGADVTGLELRASSGSTVTGHIVVEGDVSVKPNQLEFSALPLDPDQTVMNAGPPAHALIGDDLHFELAGLQGPRRLRLLRVPAGVALKAILLKGSDVTDATLTFGRPDQSLVDVEVVITTDVTEIAGSVADARGRPFNTAMVIAFALDPWLRYSRSRFVGVAAADHDARYRLEGLPPGEYYVAAADRHRSNDVEDPDFLESLTAHGTRVILGEGQHVSLTLRAR
jgi:hypothetical protein